MTNRDKLACVEREIHFRRSCYPRWVAQGKMTHHEARHEIEMMESIADDYRTKVKADEPDLFTTGSPR